MSWIIYALLTPALFSVSNFIDKYVLDKKVKDPSVMPIIAGAISFVIGICIFLLKGFVTFPLIDLLLIILSGVFFTLYLVPYYKALDYDDASRVVPLFQFIPIVVLILSFIFLKETVSMRQFIGSMFIIAGGLALSIEKIDGRLFKPRKSLYLMCLSSFIYACVIVLFRFVVVANDFWMTFAWQHIGTGLGALLLLCFSGFRKRFIKQMTVFGIGIFGILTINDLIVIAAQLSTSYALLLVSAPLVSIVGGVQPLFLLAYGIILTVFFPSLIKEDIQKETIGLKLITTFLIFIGLYLIYL